MRARGTFFKFAELLLWTKPPWWFPWPVTGGLTHTQRTQQAGLSHGLSVCVCVTILPSFCLRLTDSLPVFPKQWVKMVKRKQKRAKEWAQRCLHSVHTTSQRLYYVIQNVSCITIQTHLTLMIFLWSTGRDGEQSPAHSENFPQDGRRTPGTCTGTSN